MRHLQALYTPPPQVETGAESFHMLYGLILDSDAWGVQTSCMMETCVVRWQTWTDVLVRMW